MISSDLRLDACQKKFIALLFRVLPTTNRDIVSKAIPYSKHPEVGTRDPIGSKTYVVLVSTPNVPCSLQLHAMIGKIQRPCSVL